MTYGPVSYTHLDVYKRQILAVVWYPFFKIYDSQLGTKEKMKEEEIDSNNIEESIA